MSLIKANGAGEVSTGFYNGVATQSLRFNDDDSAYLSRTPSSTSDTKTWVWSGWVKRGNAGLYQILFMAGTSSSSNFRLVSEFTDSKFQIYYYNGGNKYILPSAVHRDHSAWYHVVFACDTTQTTDSNKLNIYINGEKLTDLSTENQPTTDYSTEINSNILHTIGRRTYASDQFFDGYLAEVNFVDGLSFFSDTSGTPNTSFNINSFGELKNGVWIAKQYTGSYGTNGFRLAFDSGDLNVSGSAITDPYGSATDVANNGLADASGQGNHWTINGISAEDFVPDSPENNFATALASLAEPQDYQNYYKGTYSEGNLKVTGSASGWSNGSSNFGMTSGKWYAECRINAKAGTGYIRFGMRARPARTYDEYFWNDDGSGQVDAATTPYSSRVGTYTAGDILMVALDLDNSAIYFGKNGTWENSATSSEIANGTTTNAFASGSVIPTDDGYTYFFYCQPYGTGSNVTWNFGQDSSFAGLETAQGNSDSGDGTTDFYYTPPTGFLANTTVNLPEPTISPNADNGTADDYFNTVLYTGNGGSSTLAVTGMGFSADWLWFKNRTSANDHNVYDTNRGLSSGALLTNTSDAEDSVQRVSSIDADGFTLPATLYSYVNTSGNSYVTWGWKAGGTAVTNEQGSIISSVSANTDAGFSIVTHTGTGSVGTIGHGLGKTPALIITKGLSSGYSWFVYNHISGATKALILNSTGAEASYSTTYNNTEPTSSVFTVGTATATNGSGINYVNYIFTEIESYSKIGSYTGNGNPDGTFVYTGFRPAWVLVRDTGVADWDIQDTTRSPFNPSKERIWANLSSAETYSTYDIDFLSNGFKLRSTNPDTNSSGGTKIYMAFAENPFKYANAR